MVIFRVGIVILVGYDDLERKIAKSGAISERCEEMFTGDGGMAMDEGVRGGGGGIELMVKSHIRGGYISRCNRDSGWL